MSINNYHCRQCNAGILTKIKDIPDPESKRHVYALFRCNAGCGNERKERRYLFTISDKGSRYAEGTTEAT